MNDSHIPCHSSNAPGTMASTKPRTSEVQPQKTPDTRPTLDEAADRLLTRTKSPLGEGEVQKVVETFERPRHPMSLQMRRCFLRLVKICGEYGILPSSCIIPQSKIQKLGDAPTSSGSSSDVWLGMFWENGDKEDDDEGKPVAIKMIRYGESDSVRAIKKSFCREVITWKRLSHPNILKLIGAMMNEKECCMVSPWMENGSIIKFLRENRQASPLKLLEEAVRGLQYLHNMELAHGCLRGANILVSEEGCACLADIGHTGVAGDLNSISAVSCASATDGVSTIRWCPPELLDPERFGSKKGSSPTKKADIYSLGMTIYEILTDKAPFYEHRDFVAMFHIVQGVRPEKPIFAITRGYTEELWGVTTSCWDEDPLKRPTVDRVLDTLETAAGKWKPRG